MKQVYVAGFLFDNSLDSVALIRKERPDWQKGKLNGIGGKVETGENPDFAMPREFVEETGVWLDGWRYFTELKGEDWIVYFYYNIDTYSLVKLKSTTDEEVVIKRISKLDSKECLPNIKCFI